MTLLKFVNVFFFQWFFVRLTRCEEKIVLFGKETPMIIRWYSLQYWIVPCTGWTYDFEFVSKTPLFYRVSPRKILN